MGQWPGGEGAGTIYKGVRTSQSRRSTRTSFLSCLLGVSPRSPEPIPPLSEVYFGGGGMENMPGSSHSQPFSSSLQLSPVPGSTPSLPQSMTLLMTQLPQMQPEMKARLAALPQLGLTKEAWGHPGREGMKTEALFALCLVLFAEPAVCTQLGGGRPAIPK